jgi:ribosomal-protein-alanine N-acetyltransferase
MQYTSENLLLKPVSLHDLEDIHRLHALPETDRYNTQGIPQNIEQTRALMIDWLMQIQNHTRHTFCLIREEQFIGIIGMNMGKPGYSSAEIWYKLLPEHWGKGYATEAVRRILSYGFHDLKLHRIEAGCVTENIASKRVLEKTGFTLEGICRRKIPIRGEWKDGYQFALLEMEYRLL